MAMKNCKNKCLCNKCARITTNCAECKESVKRTRDCLNEGIKECELFKEE